MNKMKGNKLLFLCPTYPCIGGVETVTSLLVDFFLTNDFEVSILISGSGRMSGGSILDKYATLMIPMKGEINTKENLDFIDNYIRTHFFACVINQGLFSEIYQRAASFKDVLFINTLHNKPFWEIEKFRLSSLTQLLEKEHKPYQRFKIFIRFVLNHIKPGWSHPSIWSFYKKQIDLVSYYVVLDASYKKILEERLYDGIAQNKIIAIPNPLIIPDIPVSVKKKQVIWVGRLAAVQKRVDRLLRIWKSVQSEINDWELLIIGDGEQRTELENMAGDLKLNNVRFMGNRQTDPFYNSASILCLTSSFEGFPMVLPEAQSYGCVPVSFDCATAISSIIDSGTDGLIIKLFDEEEFARELLRLIKDEPLRIQMAQKAREKASEFALEKIGQQWLNLLQ